MTPFIIILIILIAVFAVIIIVKNQYNSPYNKGERGEEQVDSILRHCALPSDKVICNIILKNPNGNSTSQIDNLLISQRGIFVIETKNYSGRIYGNDSQQYWTQVLNYGKVKNRHYSPVKQNTVHVNTIKYILNSNYPIYNVVVFVQGNISYIDSKFVYDLHGLCDFIQEHPATALSKSDIDNVFIALMHVKDTSDNATEKHIQNVNRQQELIKRNLCPRCGGVLKLISGKYGEFYGCSNYPKCKFKKNKE